MTYGESSISDNSDLIACTVAWKDGLKIRRFLVIDIMQLILVEPDTKRLGWGVAKLVGFLQDIEVTGDKDDSRCLHITIHRPLSNTSANRIPLLSAKFIFDDNIRCMAAKQRLTKGRIKARQKKMHHIARLLDIPGQSGPPSPAYVSSGNYSSRNANRNVRDNRMFHTSRVPGFAAPRRESLPGIIHRADERVRRDSGSPHAMPNVKRDDQRPSSAGVRRESQARSRESSNSRTRSREGSPRMPRPRSEEIPLELIKKAPNSVADMTPKIAILPRPQTPRLVECGEPLTPSPIEINQSNGKPPMEAAVSTSSEETSFMASDERNATPRRKGIVETV